MVVQDSAHPLDTAWFLKYFHQKIISDKEMGI
jgi:hypothetical protein